MLLSMFIDETKEAITSKQGEVLRSLFRIKMKIKNRLFDFIKTISQKNNYQNNKKKGV